MNDITEGIMYKLDKILYGLIQSCRINNEYDVYKCVRRENNEMIKYNV